ncbi:hypothetical protein WICANDRAFT_62439 [Wickerhamomyces anomalus NRRL Y-366-8]|uniref:Uncharacterized protein n=1 Tax=Wickerhamomyces anomalus (strain ATCC 58044 / CBS 1984 / NCYC 433 / NRRL Y-366-8) TaxID=683960 RepID=A0A1E3P3S5_WICAA|nr:uncharacterized protein WICANDRAFT_62439 [Wickerhamomyces anomalus NRRL Y-366-8]ODQ59854.1 hypothetical protein WICANDRAFT_62439 [Wickerhamomyces anomalus NRRL Y-366-8]
MVNYVITGTNKPNGIGQNLVKEIAKDDNNRVFATVRDPSKAPELVSFAKEHSNVEVITLTDVTSEEATQDAVKAVEAKLDADEGIDILIPNAGYSSAIAKILDISAENFLFHWKVNALGNIITFQKFYPLMKKAKTKQVFFTSTISASISGYVPGTISSPYGSAKAALNHLVRDLNGELNNEGFKFVAYHPGFVATETANIVVRKTFPDLGEKSLTEIGAIEVEASVKGIKENIIDGLNDGKITTDDFWNWDGSKGQW